MKKILLITCALIVSSLSYAEKYDQPDYEMLKKSGNIEVRKYKEANVAQVALKSEEAGDRNEAFMKLFRYIQGANDKKQKIAMTIPVSQKENADKTWSFSFFVPKEIEWENIPKPKNEKIEIKKIKSKEVVVIKWRGSIKDRNKNKYKSLLKKYIEENNLKVNQEPIFAYYSGPFTPWFLKTHELMYEIVE